MYTTFIGLAVLALSVGLLPVPAHAQTDQYTALANSNIRSEPTTRSRIIGGLRQGDTIRVTGDAADGNWYQVELGDGRTGYIFGRLLQAPAAVTNLEESPEVDQAEGERSPAPENAYLYIVSPRDGEVLPPSGQVWVAFGLREMGVAPAGVTRQFTGHHHLLLNTGVPPLDQPIPSDDNHIHFGRGQTEYLLQLPPGEHTLQLILGDHDHVPHDPPVMSQQITVYVPES
jgi:hypothetical protein